jgi:hypothetical protein
MEVFLTLHAPTREMEKEAISGGSAERGPSGLARRFGVLEVEDRPPTSMERLQTLRKAVETPGAKPVAKPVAKLLVAKPRSAAGRPSKHSDRPWEVEGVSRRTSGQRVQVNGV